VKVNWITKDGSKEVWPTNRKTVFRIIRYEHLVQLFKEKKYALVSPLKWEDPFEKLWSQLVFKEKVQHDAMVKRVYGSCLTYKSRSDALWNIYSRNWLGIRICLDLDELQTQMEGSSELSFGRTWFGEVNYLRDLDLKRKAESLVKTVNLPGIDHTEILANVWLNKRTGYSHEDEMRVFFVSPENKTEESNDIFKFSIDPHKLIKSIHIDPRAPTELFETLKRDIKSSLGYQGSVKHSALLRLPPSMKNLLNN